MPDRTHQLAPAQPTRQSILSQWRARLVAWFSTDPSFQAPPAVVPFEDLVRNRLATHALVPISARGPVTGPTVRQGAPSPQALQRAQVGQPQPRQMRHHF